MEPTSQPANELASQPAREAEQTLAAAPPRQRRAAASIDELLEQVVARDASDLHVTVGSEPVVRINGRLERLDEFSRLSPEDTQLMLYRILSTEQQKHFETNRQIDISYSIPGLARFRVNVYFQRESLGAAFRLIPAELKTLEQLGLPPVLKDFTTKPRGLVLVTGPTGSGKSTTLAAIVNELNRTSQRHVITIEDPIEFLHPPEQCAITQRQVGEHAESAASALRAALREAPDVLVVGELRDQEMISLALSAAETGALVFGTLRTNSAAKAMSRVLELIPDESRDQVRSVLSVLLRGVICQQLCRRASGEGRIAALEILLQNHAVASMIRENNFHQVDAYLANDSTDGSGSISLEHCLARYVREEQVAPEEAQRIATYPDQLKKLIEAP